MWVDGGLQSRKEQTKPRSAEIDYTLKSHHLHRHKGWKAQSVNHSFSCLDHKRSKLIETADDLVPARHLTRTNSARRWLLLNVRGHFRLHCSTQIAAAKYGLNPAETFSDETPTSENSFIHPLHTNPLVTVHRQASPLPRWGRLWSFSDCHPLPFHFLAINFNLWQVWRERKH